MRYYTTSDLLRFHKFATGKDKPGIELIKEYNKLYPELTAKQKLKNLIKFLEDYDTTQTNKRKAGQNNKSLILLNIFARRN